MWLLGKLAPSSTKPHLDSVNGIFAGANLTLWNTLLRLNVSRDDVADDILLVGICRATEIMKQNIFYAYKLYKQKYVQSSQQ